MRAFLAILVPAETQRALYALQERLGGRERGWRWVRGPEQMHLTLTFLGEIDDHLQELLITEMEEIAGVCAPFPLTIQGFGFFPTPPRPRVFWAGVADPDPALLSLKERLDERLLAYDYPRDSRPYTPHVTLARRKGGGRFPGQRWLDALTEEAGRAWTSTVDRFVLFRSTLAPAGAAYDVVAEFPFRR